MQLSADVPQSWQVTPPPPQAVTPGVWQAPFKQQPPSQFEALHPLQAWRVHVWLAGHIWQGPFFPQAPIAVPGRPRRMAICKKTSVAVARKVAVRSDGALSAT